MRRSIATSTVTSLIATSTVTSLIFLYLVPHVHTRMRGQTQPQQKGNIFAAIAHMEPLVEIERRLADITRDYLNEQKKKLSELAPFAKSVEEALDLSEGDPERYLGNPINCYLIIKRFTSGWKELTSRLDIDNNSLKDIGDLLKANEMYLPTEQQDVIGATTAIIRLQDNYDISAREISEGLISDMAPSVHQFTAADCLDIADICHKSSRYVRMKEWLKEAERIINDPKLNHRHGNTTILALHEFLAWSCYLENDLPEALKYTNLVLTVDATSQTAIENHKVYSWYVSTNTPCTLPETQYMRLAQEFLESRKQASYRLCKERNTNVKGIKNINNLRCYYRRDHPLLILKPAKLSLIHDNPEIYVIHDAATEWEMEELKEVATPRLKLAEVLDPDSDERVNAAYRISKSMFMDMRYKKDYHLAKRMDPRFAAMTGLDFQFAEELQMNNYGLGGQYEFHHDYGLPGSLLEKSETGNRIATMLLYLSDVERGGETVFIDLGIATKPTKGDALFWYNLHRNGTGIARTKHASCPVVSGSKWVANKWIRLGGNEFKRPCSLNRFE